MSVRRINHVSVHAADLDVSEAFYSELFGVSRLPTPDFGFPVRWLKVGDMQLHLFNRAVEAPSNHHFALTVDDLKRSTGRQRREGRWTAPRCAGCPMARPRCTSATLPETSSSATPRMRTRSTHRWSVS